MLAFEYLHNHNVVYRDLKPENVLVDTRGYVKIIDFGFAKKVVHRTYTFCGTMEYMCARWDASRIRRRPRCTRTAPWLTSLLGSSLDSAPEVANCRGHAFPADWWTLGVLIYELLWGYTPFTMQDTIEDPLAICQNILNPRYVIPGLESVSRETRELLLSVLMHDPFLRPSAAEIKRKASAILAQFCAIRRNSAQFSEPPLHPSEGVLCDRRLPGAPPRRAAAAARVPTVRGPLDVSNFDDYEMDDKYLKGGPYRAAPRTGTTVSDRETVAEAYNVQYPRGPAEGPGRGECRCDARHSKRVCKMDLGLVVSSTSDGRHLRTLSHTALTLNSRHGKTARLLSTASPPLELEQENAGPRIPFYSPSLRCASSTLCRWRSISPHSSPVFVPREAETATTSAFSVSAASICGSGHGATSVFVQTTTTGTERPSARATAPRIRRAYALRSSEETASHTTTATSIALDAPAAAPGTGGSWRITLDGDRRAAPPASTAVALVLLPPSLPATLLAPPSDIVESVRESSESEAPPSEPALESELDAESVRATDDTEDRALEAVGEDVAGRRRRRPPRQRLRGAAAVVLAQRADEGALPHAALAHEEHAREAVRRARRHHLLEVGRQVHRLEVAGDVSSTRELRARRVGERERGRAPAPPSGTRR